MRDLTVIHVIRARPRRAVLFERAVRLVSVSRALADAGQFYASVTYRKAALDAIRQSWALNNQNDAIT